MERTKGSTKVQSLLFEVSAWTPFRAQTWAKEHGYNASQIDQQANHLRIRQKPPSAFQAGGLRTITFGKGIKAIVGVPKPVPAPAWQRRNPQKVSAADIDAVLLQLDRPTYLTDAARSPALRGVHFRFIEASAARLARRGEILYDGAMVKPVPRRNGRRRNSPLVGAFFASQAAGATGELSRRVSKLPRADQLLTRFLHRKKTRPARLAAERAEWESSRRDRSYQNPSKGSLSTPKEIAAATYPLLMAKRHAWGHLRGLSDAQLRKLAGIIGDVLARDYKRQAVRYKRLRLGKPDPLTPALLAMFLPAQSRTYSGLVQPLDNPRRKAS